MEIYYNSDQTESSIDIEVKSYDSQHPPSISEVSNIEDDTGILAAPADDYNIEYAFGTV